MAVIEFIAGKIGLKPPETTKPLSSEAVDSAIKNAFDRMTSKEARKWQETPFFLPTNDHWLGDQIDFSGSYETCLPVLIKGKKEITVADLIESRTRIHQLTRLLDLGCSALALEQIKGRWGDRVMVQGITAQMTEERMQDLVGNSDILVEIVDAHDLVAHFGQRYFDIVISNGALGLMVDPLRVIGEVYAILKTGGTGLLSGGYWPVEKLAQLDILNRFYTRGKENIHFKIVDWVHSSNSSTLRKFAYVDVVIEKNSEQPLRSPLLKPTGFVCPWPGCPETFLYT